MQAEKAGHLKEISDFSTRFNGCKVSRGIKWAQKYHIWSIYHLSKQAEHNIFKQART